MVKVSITVHVLVVYAWHEIYITVIATLVLTGSFQGTSYNFTVPDSSNGPNSVCSLVNYQ